MNVLSLSLLLAGCINQKAAEPSSPPVVDTDDTTQDTDTDVVTHNNDDAYTLDGTVIDIASWVNVYGDQSLGLFGDGLHAEDNWSDAAAVTDPDSDGSVPVDFRNFGEGISFRWNLATLVNDADAPDDWLSLEEASRNDPHNLIVEFEECGVRKMAFCIEIQGGEIVQGECSMTYVPPAGCEDEDNDGDTDPDADNGGSADTDTDSDGDGLSNDDEEEAGTNPTDSDSDGDGHTDGDEVDDGTDPLDSEDPDDGGDTDDEDTDTDSGSGDEDHGAYGTCDADYSAIRWVYDAPDDIVSAQVEIWSGRTTSGSAKSGTQLYYGWVNSSGTESGSGTSVFDTSVSGDQVEITVDQCFPDGYTVFLSAEYDSGRYLCEGSGTVNGSSSLYVDGSSVSEDVYVKPSGGCEQMYYVE